jgi:hypothetical protein
VIQDDSDRGFYVHQIAQVHYRDSRPWVARIVGINARFGFERHFVRPRRDYSQSVKRMSGKLAGVVDCFLLETGWVCEVFEPGRGGKKHPDKRYFGRATEKGFKRLTEEEVIEWIRKARR